MRYKDMDADPENGEGLSTEFNVSTYIQENEFPLNFSKRVIYLNARSDEVNNAITTLRSISPTVTGLFLEYLLEGTMICKYNLNVSIYSFEAFGDNVFKRWCESKSYSYGRVIRMLFTTNSIHSNEDIIIYTFYKTFVTLNNFNGDIETIATIADSPEVITIINYFTHELIPQLNIRDEVTFEPGFLTVRGQYALRSNPDFIIDGNVIDMKVASQHKWMQWARQLYLYSEGMRQNGYGVNKCYILNVLSNILVEYSFY